MSVQNITTPAVTIIDSGTDAATGFLYKKYSDGTYYAYKISNYNGINITSNWGNYLYRSSALTVPNIPSGITVTSRRARIHNNGQDIMWLGDFNNNYYLCYVLSQSNVSISLLWEIWGTWV
jgi:hypothetical protein